LEKNHPRWTFVFWRDPNVFRPGDATLEGLEKVIRNSDFGIYVLTPDDKLVIRHRQKITARGNVIFELGIGIGRHRRERSFIVHDDVYTISDLSGITTIPYAALPASKGSRAKVAMRDSDEYRRVADVISKATQAEILAAEELWKISHPNS
jgi:predicted nucleotide-binding protein